VYGDRGRQVRIKDYSGSVGQFDSVGMLLVALVIVRKNLFEPTSLFLGESRIDQSWLVIDNELFAATVTPESPHFLQTGCFLVTLPLLYCNCPHLPNFSCQGGYDQV
jgi:hypothetical protein